MEDSNIINSFYQYINKNDIRVKKQDSSPTYHITQLQEYDGPNIDWNGYQLSFMSEQMYKGFHEANVRLTSIEKNLSHVILDGREQKTVNSKNH